MLVSFFFFSSTFYQGGFFFFIFFSRLVLLRGTLLCFKLGFSRGSFRDSIPILSRSVDGDGGTCTYFS